MSVRPYTGLVIADENVNARIADSLRGFKLRRNRALALFLALRGGWHPGWLNPYEIDDSLYAAICWFVPEKSSGGQAISADTAIRRFQNYWRISNGGPLTEKQLQEVKNYLNMCERKVKDDTYGIVDRRESGIHVADEFGIALAQIKSLFSHPNSYGEDRHGFARALFGWWFGDESRKQKKFKIADCTELLRNFAAYDGDVVAFVTQTLRCDRSELMTRFRISGPSRLMKILRGEAAPGDRETFEAMLTDFVESAQIEASLYNPEWAGRVANFLGVDPSADQARELFSAILEGATKLITSFTSNLVNRLVERNEAYWKLNDREAELRHYHDILNAFEDDFRQKQEVNDPGYFFDRKQAKALRKFLVTLFETGDESRAILLAQEESKRIDIPMARFVAQQIKADEVDQLLAAFELKADQQKYGNLKAGFINFEGASHLYFGVSRPTAKIVEQQNNSVVVSINLPDWDAKVVRECRVTVAARRFVNEILTSNENGTPVPRNSFRVRKIRGLGRDEIGKVTASTKDIGITLQESKGTPENPKHYLTFSVDLGNEDVKLEPLNEDDLVVAFRHVRDVDNFGTGVVCRFSARDGQFAVTVKKEVVGYLTPVPNRQIKVEHYSVDRAGRRYNLFSPGDIAPKTEVAKFNALLSQFDAPKIDREGLWIKQFDYACRKLRSKIKSDKTSRDAIFALLGMMEEFIPGIHKGGLSEERIQAYQNLRRLFSRFKSLCDKEQKKSHVESEIERLFARHAAIRRERLRIIASQTVVQAFQAGAKTVIVEDSNARTSGVNSKKQNVAITNASMTGLQDEIGHYAESEGIPYIQVKAFGTFSDPASEDKSWLLRHSHIDATSEKNEFLLRRIENVLTGRVDATKTYNAALREWLGKRGIASVQDFKAYVQKNRDYIPDSYGRFVFTKHGWSLVTTNAAYNTAVNGVGSILFREKNRAKRTAKA